LDVETRSDPEAAAPVGGAVEIAHGAILPDGELADDPGPLDDALDLQRTGSSAEAALGRAELRARTGGEQDDDDHGEEPDASHVRTVRPRAPGGQGTSVWHSAGRPW
jgi:hypothetical protein